jgi:bZIP transcription factor
MELDNSPLGQLTTKPLDDMDASMIEEAPPSIWGSVSHFQPTAQLPTSPLLEQHDQLQSVTFDMSSVSNSSRTSGSPVPDSDLLTASPHDGLQSPQEPAFMAPLGSAPVSASDSNFHSAMWGGVVSHSGATMVSGSMFPSLLIHDDVKTEAASRASNGASTASSVASSGVHDMPLDPVVSQAMMQADGFLFDGPSSMPKFTSLPSAHGPTTITPSPRGDHQHATQLAPNQVVAPAVTPAVATSAPAAAQASTATNTTSNKRKTKSKKKGKKSKKADKSSFSSTRTGYAPSSRYEPLSNKRNRSIAEKLQLQRQQLNALANRPGLSEDEKKDIKRRQRLLRNRISAQLSRERKRDYLQQLKKQLSDLMDQNRTLSSQVQDLSSENASLQQRVKTLEKLSEADMPLCGSASACAPEPPTFGAYANLSPDGPNPRPKKRAKVEPSSESTVSSAMRFPARAGMVLFALVFSFGVLYNVVGIDYTDVQNAQVVKVLQNRELTSIDAPVFHGRMLQAVNKQREFDAEMEDAASKKFSATGNGSTALVTMLAEQEKALAVVPKWANDAAVAASESTVASTVAKQPDMNGSPTIETGAAHTAASKQLVVSPDQLRLLSQRLQATLTTGNGTVTSGVAPPPSARSSDEKGPLSAAAASVRSRLANVIVNGDPNFHQDALQVYNKNIAEIQHQFTWALEQYKQDLLRTNRSMESRPSSILFCPSAMYVTPSGTAANASMDDVALWIPTHKLIANSDVPLFSSAKTLKMDALTELSVKIL